MSKLMYDRDMVPGTSGNVSVRVPGTETVLIKCTARSFGDLDCDDVLLVDLDGKVLEGQRQAVEGGGLPPAALPAAAWTSARWFTCTRPTPRPGPAPAGSFRWRPSRPSSSSDRFRWWSAPIPVRLPWPTWSCEAYQDPSVKVALLKDHGAVVVGPNLREAYYLADLVEDTARIATLTGLVKLIP